MLNILFVHSSARRMRLLRNNGKALITKFRFDVTNFFLGAVIYKLSQCRIISILIYIFFKLLTTLLRVLSVHQSIMKVFGHENIVELPRRVLSTSFWALIWADQCPSGWTIVTTGYSGPVYNGLIFTFFSSLPQWRGGGGGFVSRGGNSRGFFRRKVLGASQAGRFSRGPASRNPIMKPWLSSL